MELDKQYGLIHPCIDIRPIVREPINFFQTCNVVPADSVRQIIGMEMHTIHIRGWHMYNSYKMQEQKLSSNILIGTTLNED